MTQRFASVLFRQPVAFSRSRMVTKSCVAPHRINLSEK